MFFEDAICDWAAFHARKRIPSASKLKMFGDGRCTATAAAPFENSASSARLFYLMKVIVEIRLPVRVDLKLPIFTHGANFSFISVEEIAARVNLFGFGIQLVFLVVLM